jgi:assimilatory nitrate reductase catalytic subunit
MTAEAAATVRTTCPYCGVGCGVLASRAADGTVSVSGDPEHPANAGRLCSKGSALAETLSLEGRLLHPLIYGQRASWDDALELVARRFGETIAVHGPDSVAFYVSGQLLTEDYYVANKLMKGFIGSANIDTNSRLCMASSVAGHRRAFGSDTVPGCYEDLELADLVVLVGSNLAWCHPVLFQRLSAARATRGTKVVVIDPRVTATCEIADLHLPLASGSDVALFNGLLAHLHARGAIDHAWVEAYTSGYQAALDTAQSTPLANIARITGLGEADILRFYEIFAATAKTVTVYSQGVNQSSAGTDKVSAIINCHLATGRIGKPGAGPFSVTGQPNAMGGREVGGLANMLAAHMEIENASHREIVRTFWHSPPVYSHQNNLPPEGEGAPKWRKGDGATPAASCSLRHPPSGAARHLPPPGEGEPISYANAVQSPRIADRPGLKAIDMFRAVADGRIKAIWIMATNPVDSLPEADLVRAALQQCSFVVVSDIERHTDTTALAHVLLPSLAWGEKDGAVTNSERCISRQRSFLPAPGEARADWWQLAEVARRMGFGSQFAWSGPAEIFAEHARLSYIANAGTRDFDIGAYAGADDAAYDALEPFHWPRSLGDDTASRQRRFFADGRFFTPDRRGRFVPTPWRPPATGVSAAWPLVLNTGRIRDQWHTMTRSAKSARLMRHLAEPFVEIHPDDATRLGLASAHLAEITSAHGSVIARLLLTTRQISGRVFAPMHWTDRFASQARVDSLVGAHLDPVSGQPELKHTPVQVRPFPAAWYGFAVCRRRPALQSEYWAIARAKGGWRAELAGLRAPADWTETAHALLAGGEKQDGLDVLAYFDRSTGQHRFAAFEDDRLTGALFVSPEPVAVARDFIADQLEASFAAPAERFRLLAGRAPAGRPDAGPIVCACFEVGRNRILEVIRASGGASVETVGAATSAGTNCGSCRAEIGELIHADCLAKAG